MIKRASLSIVPLRFKQPIVTSQQVLHVRRTLILRIETSDGLVGCGEGVAFETPWYTSETIHSLISGSHLIWSWLDRNTKDPSEFLEQMKQFKGQPMLTSMWESALRDLHLQREGMTLKRWLNGQDTVDCGRTIGISSLQHTLTELERALDQGFRRIKLKAKPEQLLSSLTDIRHHFPDAPLMIDLNESGAGQTLDWFKRLDAHRLLMIEQPYAAGDWRATKHLHDAIDTPICLDESISGVTDVETMLHFGAGSIVNIKPTRVGGLTEALRIREMGVPYWVGGMFESSIGRYETLVFASLEGSAFPADMSGTSAYFEEDLLHETFEIENGSLSIPDRIHIDWATIERLREDVISFT